MNQNFNKQYFNIFTIHLLLCVVGAMTSKASCNLCECYIVLGFAFANHNKTKDKINKQNTVNNSEVYIYIYIYKKLDNHLKQQH